MKRGKAAGKFLLCAAIIFLLADSAVAADKIRISISSLDAAFLTAGVAFKRGFFKEEGLDTELIRMNANVSITALATGDIDYTMIFGSVIRAAMRGIPLRVIAVLLDSPPYALIARPQFNDTKALKGKNIGIGVYGSSNDVVTRMILERSGIDPERETKLIAFGTDGARFAALKEGLVDAAIIAPPGDAQARRMGFKVLARANELFKFPHIGLGASSRKIKEKPQEVVHVIKSFIRANQFIRENRQKSVNVLIDGGRTQRDDAIDAYDSTWQVFSPDGSLADDGMRLVIDDARKALKIERAVPLAEVADMSALREAQRELGIKPR